MTLTEKLDYALVENKINGVGNDEIGQNVLIIGPPGTGKTTQVFDWVDNHKDDFNTYYFPANMRPHLSEVEVNGNKIRCLFDREEVESLNKEDNVLIIEHFDLTDNEVRKELMSLVRNRELTSPYLEGEKIKLDKFWYIIAIAYPEGHFDYDGLSFNDLRSFNYVFYSVDFYSKANNEEGYINDVVKDIISKLDDDGKRYYMTASINDRYTIERWIRNEYIWNRIIPSDKSPDDLSEEIFDKLIGTIYANLHKH